MFPDSMLSGGLTGHERAGKRANYSHILYG